MAAIFQTTFWNWFSSMKMYEYRLKCHFAPSGQINNIPALVQIMAWRRPGDKPLSETMMVSLLTHICVTRPQWVKTLHINTDAHGQCCVAWDDLWQNKSICICAKCILSETTNTQPNPYFKGNNAHEIKMTVLQVLLWDKTIIHAHWISTPPARKIPEILV